MNKSKFLLLARKFNSVLFEENECLAGALPLVVAGHTVGLVRAELLPLVRRAADVFCVSDAAVTLQPALDTYDARTEALAQLLQQWRHTADLTALRGWRDECYDVRPDFTSPALLRMERSATSVFGVQQYGVDLNGYTHHPEKGLCVWIQRRSRTKPTWPGKLDNMVSGGLTSGLSVLEAVQKEAWEEAGVPEHMMPAIRAAGTLSICFRSPRGLFPNTEFVYDLELPHDWQPTPQDGEVEDFFLTPVKELMDMVCSDEFKTTSAPITLDFLVRHGFITPSNEPDYVELCQLLHVPLQRYFTSGRLLHVLRR